MFVNVQKRETAVWTLLIQAAVCNLLFRSHLNTIHDFPDQPTVSHNCLPVFQQHAKCHKEHLPYPLLVQMFVDLDSVLEEILTGYCEAYKLFKFSVIQ